MCTCNAFKKAMGYQSVQHLSKFPLNSFKFYVIGKTLSTLETDYYLV